MNQGVKAKATLGRTKYELESGSAGMLRVTRTNDSVTTIFFPEELIIIYVAQLVEKQRAEAISKQSPYDRLGLRKP